MQIATTPMLNLVPVDEVASQSHVRQSQQERTLKRGIGGPCQADAARAHAGAADRGQHRQGVLRRVVLPAAGPSPPLHLTAPCWPLLLVSL